MQGLETGHVHKGLDVKYVRDRAFAYDPKPANIAYYLTFLSYAYFAFDGSGTTHYLLAPKLREPT